MAYVVTQPCFGCKYGDCVDVCPVECIYEGEEIFYINPDECVNCDVCVAACPVGAIYAEEDVPVAWQGYIALNAELAKG